MNKRLRNNLGRPQVLTILGTNTTLRATSYAYFDREITEEELNDILGIKSLISKGFILVEEGSQEPLAEGINEKKGGKK